MKATVRYSLFLLMIVFLFCPLPAFAEEENSPPPFFSLDSHVTVTLSQEELMAPEDSIVTLSVLIENPSPFILRDCSLVLDSLPEGISFVPGSLTISSVSYPGLYPDGSVLGNVQVYHTVGATFQLQVSSQTPAGTYEISAGFQGSFQNRDRQMGTVSGKSSASLTVYRPIAFTDEDSPLEAALGSPVVYHYAVSPDSLLGPNETPLYLSDLKLQIVLPQGGGILEEDCLYVNDEKTELEIHPVTEPDPEGDCLDLSEFIKNGRLTSFDFSYSVQTAQNLLYQSLFDDGMDTVISQPVLFYRLAGETNWRSVSLSTETSLRNRKTYSYQWSSAGQACYFSVSSHVRDINSFQVTPVFFQGELYETFRSYASSSSRKITALCTASISDEEEPVTLSPYTISFFNLDKLEGQQAFIFYLREDGSIGERPAIVKNGQVSSEFSSLTTYALAIPDETYGKVPEYEILSSTGSGGTIQPSGISRMTEGSSAEFLIQPFYGYRVEKLLVDGESLPPAESYTFENITSDHEIHVVFTKEGVTPSPLDSQVSEEFPWAAAAAVGAVAIAGFIFFRRKAKYPSDN